MIRVGWLADEIPGQFHGGAEMVAQELKNAAPEWCSIVPCPAGSVSTDVDVYVCHNIFQYGADTIQALMTKPTVRFCYDITMPGDPALRDWILRNAKLLIFQSPLSYVHFPHLILVPTRFMPPHINYEMFKRAGEASMSQRIRERKGVVWLGRMFHGKGVREAVAWAAENKTLVEFYGFGPGSEYVTGEYAHYNGAVEKYEDIPAILAGYEKFLFIPTEIDAFSRTAIEAWYAGCELIVNGNMGCLWWLRNDPAAIEQAGDRFWDAVKEVANAE
jgi:hypothetical protein